MYRDDRRLHATAVKVRLDADINRRVESLCEFTGDQKAVVVRRLMLLGMRKFHAVYGIGAAPGVEGIKRAGTG